MNLNEVDIHYLIAAISVITSALVFYTIGVWGERLQKIRGVKRNAIN